MPSHLPATARHAVFAPLDGAGRAELVARRLTDAIRLGFVVDGEQLPSEAELAAQLNVSTVTLREALAMLRQRGLVQTRRGRGGGTFVRSPAHGAAARMRARLREVPVDDLRDAGDHHAAIAAAAARLAAERASDVDLERLREHVEHLEAAEGPDRERADVRFHVEVAATARSARLTRDEMAAQAQTARLVWMAMGAEAAPLDGAAAAGEGSPIGGATATGEGSPIDGAAAPGDSGLAAHVAEHRALLAAIAEGDGERAARLAAAHVAAATGRLLALRLRLAGGAAGAAGPATSRAERRRRARAVLAGVAEELEAVYASAGELRSALLAAEAAARAGRRPLRRSDLADVRALAQEHLARHGDLVAGTGVVCTPGLLEDAPRWLEWWCASPDGAPRMLVVGVDPEDPDFYDYETAEWFAAPRRTRERHLAGPFVDYSGTNQHIFTPTVPIAPNGRYLGIAGADVLVGRFATLLAPTLAALGEDAALVNHRGRVIAANAPGHVSGALIAPADLAWLETTSGAWTVRADGAAIARDRRLPWALLLAPPAT